MRTLWSWCSIAVLALALDPVLADDAPRALPSQDSSEGPESLPAQVKIDPSKILPRDAAPAGECEPECEPSCPEDCGDKCEPVKYAPTMFGDFLTVRLVPAPVVSPTEVQAVPGSNAFAIPVARGAFKVAENESPRPQNRLFGSYNYYDEVRGPIFIGSVHREVIGFEKTLFEGAASVGARLPFFQTENGFRDEDMDDVSAVFKFAAVNNLETGNLVSLGMVVTAPTGKNPTFILPNGSTVHSTQLQPFVGYYWNSRGLFIHGFSSVMVPTNSNDVIIAFNDIGIGYSLFGNRQRFLSAVLPTFEAHVNTPVNQREAGVPYRYQDLVDLTLGVSFILNQRSSVGVAAATPVTGPRLFDIEGLANFNWRF